MSADNSARALGGRDDEQPVPSGISPQVAQVYEGVGKVMSRYTTGKVPKAFKIIPNLKNWEEVSLASWKNDDRYENPPSSVSVP
jgi:essential nuclear protein 1